MSYCWACAGLTTRHGPATVGNEWRTGAGTVSAWSPRTGSARCRAFLPGPEPHGFMLRDEIVSYLESYARSFGPPLAEHTTATRLTQRPRGGFRDPHQPRHDHRGPGGGGHRSVPGAAHARLGHRLPDDVRQIHSAQYRNPAELPPGAVLVVGTGPVRWPDRRGPASGRAHGASGDRQRARVTRFYRGRDVVDWLADMGSTRAASMSSATPTRSGSGPTTT